jgi:hypothetical protein
VEVVSSRREIKYSKYTQAEGRSDLFAEYVRACRSLQQSAIFAIK